MVTRPTVKISLHLSPEKNLVLERLCDENHMTKSNLLRNALTLMDIALTSKKRGNHLIVVDNKEKKVCEVLGL